MFRFTLHTLCNNTSIQFRTLKDISEFLDLPYHKNRSLSLSDEKIFLHKEIKELSKQYKIVKNQPILEF